MRATVDSAMDLACNGHAGKLANGFDKSVSLSEANLPTRELPAGAADNWKLHEFISVVDKRDAATPDCWIPRHPELIRLTGRCVPEHPLTLTEPHSAAVQAPEHGVSLRHLRHLAPCACRRVDASGICCRDVCSLLSGGTLFTLSTACSSIFMSCRHQAQDRLSSSSSVRSRRS